MTRLSSLDEIDIPGLGKVKKTGVRTVMRVGGNRGRLYLLVVFTDGGCQAIPDDPGHAASIEKLGFTIESPRLQRPILGDRTGDDILRENPSWVGVIASDADGQRMAVVVEPSWQFHLWIKPFKQRPVNTATWKTIDMLSKQTLEDYSNESNKKAKKKQNASGDLPRISVKPKLQG